MGEKTAAVPSGDGRPGIQGKPEVMIVDDEPITARGYARALTAAGYNVTIAAAGREGATLARSKRFDAIVSDIAMPDMDGLALLRDIRQSRSRRADDLHDRQPGAGDGDGGDRVRRVSLPAEARAAGRAAGDRPPRRRRAQAGAGPARGEPDQGAGGEVDRRSGRAGGEVRVGGRQAVGRRAADRFVVGAQTIFAYETLLRTDEPTLRSPLDFFDAAERLGKAAELGASSARHVAVLLAGTRPARARVREPAPRRPRGSRSCTPTTAR